MRINKKSRSFFFLFFSFCGICTVVQYASKVLYNNGIRERRKKRRGGRRDKGWNMHEYRKKKKKKKKIWQEYSWYTLSLPFFYYISYILFSYIVYTLLLVTPPTPLQASILVYIYISYMIYSCLLVILTSMFCYTVWYIKKGSPAFDLPRWRHGVVFMRWRLLFLVGETYIYTLKYIKKKRPYNRSPVTHCLS